MLRGAPQLFRDFCVDATSDPVRASGTEICVDTCECASRRKLPFETNQLRVLLFCDSSSMLPVSSPILAVFVCVNMLHVPQTSILYTRPNSGFAWVLTGRLDWIPVSHVCVLICMRVAAFADLPFRLSSTKCDRACLGFVAVAGSTWLLALSRRQLHSRNA